MQVNSISSNPAAAAAATAPAAALSGKTLGVADFMKLLATQFQQQDPLKPMDDTAFIAQTAQFTALQQTTTLAQQMTQLRATQDLSTANGYIGRQVTVDRGDELPAVGTVTAVETSESGPRIIVDGIPYPLSAVLRLEPAA